MEAIKKDETFIKLYNSILKNKDLNSNEKIMISLFLSYESNGKRCFLSNKKLGEYIGVDSNRMSYIVAGLKNKGFIDTSVVYKKNKSNDKVTTVDIRYIWTTLKEELT